MGKPEHDADDRPAGLQTLSIALEIINELQAANGATVNELQERLGLSKSAIYNHLNTLCEHGFVVKQNEEFELSLMFTLLGEFVRERNDLYEVAKEPIEDLADSVEYTAHLVTEQHYNRIEVDVARGEKAVGRRFTSVYDALDFHTTANGKAFLAFVDEETRERILDKHGLSQRTPNTITDRSTLEEELELIRERGYAINDEEEIEGLRGVAAPIKGRGGAVEGAVAIDAPVERMTIDRIHDELAEKVIETANVIQVDLNMGSRTH